MALHQFKFTNAIIEEYFGPVIAAVCEELKWGPKPLKLLSSNVKFSLAVVKQALSVLINFNFVEFKIPEDSFNCEYSIIPENILMLLKYSRFIFIIRKKYGKEAEYIIQELLYASRMTLYTLIIKVTYNLSQVHSEIPYSLSTIKNSVCNLIENGFIVPVERVTEDVVPVSIALSESEKEPQIDMQKLTNLYHGTETDFPEKQLYWRVNFDRFLIEYRDEFLHRAMTERIDAQAGIVVHHLLKLSFVKTDLWRPISNPVPMMLVRDSIGSDTDAADALKYAEQYIRVMEEDLGGFIGRSAEYSGGILLCFKGVMEHLTVQCIGQIVDQKFGSKAARVFRLVHHKKYIELEQIQRLAMLADKEAKQITYKLLEENFLQMQELRKPTTNANSSGPNKSFFLFYVDINLIVPMVIGMCSKAMFNLLLKCREEQYKHSHIVDKKKQSDFVIQALKEQKVTEDQILEVVKEIISPPEKVLLDSLQRVIKKLNLGILQINETIFLLELYIRYHKATVPRAKLLQK